MSRTRKSRAKKKEDLLIHPWTNPEIRILLDHYEERGPDYCANLLQAHGYDRSVTSTNQKGISIGLRYKGPRKGCFKPGIIPANKGKKMPDHLYQRIKATMFKKCHKSQNILPVGTVVFRKSDGYYWTKVALPSKWVQTHRLVWESHNGQIPAGHIVVFRNGNPHNFDINNLELITKKENLYRNRWGEGPSQYSLLSRRAAQIHLNKRGIPDKVINANPELLEVAQSEILLKLQTRKLRHATHIKK